MKENHGHAPRPAEYASIKSRWALLLLLVVSTFIVYTNAGTLPPPEDLKTTAALHDAHDAQDTRENDAQDYAVAPAMPAGETPAATTTAAPERIAHAPRAAAKPAAPASAPNEKIRRHKVKTGDTISSILERNGVGSAMKELLPFDKTSPSLFALNQGDTVELVIRDGHLHALKRELDKKTEILALLEDGRYTVEKIRKKTSIRRAFAAGTVTDSFYAAGLSAHLSDKIILSAVHILGWDIDFSQDVRAGDSFVIVYDEEWLQGEKLEDLEILAVEYTSRGRSHRAAKYTDASGRTHYYTPDGKSVKRPFIRMPLKFTRISSRFNPRRLHPILKVHRPHRGVDYAAPIGTPVYSAGHGTIVFRGRKGGYGNVVIIQHGHRYKTVYAHLSKFARRQRVGSRVEQREIIGYVGQTGYATGPHLHYEFRVNDVHKDPLKVRLPRSESLPKAEIAHFQAKTRSSWEALDTLGQRHLVAE